MTDAPAVIEATFCGFRTVGGRKQLQLTFEVPIEHSAKVLHVLGSPDAVDPSWVAIALLDKQLMKAQGAVAPALPKSTPPLVNTREKRNWKAVSPAEQAGMRCSEAAFKRYLTEKHGVPEDFDPAEYVRRYCNIASRSDLNTNFEAAEKWGRLSDGFDVWMRAAV